MSCQLPADPLNENFEYLGDEREEVALHSCLLVNRLWCEVSDPILWTNIQNYNTLFACLTNESKEILYKNEIIISTSTSKPASSNFEKIDCRNDFKKKATSLSQKFTHQQISLSPNTYSPTNIINPSYHPLHCC